MRRITSFKKIIAFAIALVLVLTLASCGNSNTAKTEESETPTDTEDAEEETPEEAEDSETSAETDAANEETPEEAEDSETPADTEDAEPESEPVSEGAALQKSEYIKVLRGLVENHKEPIMGTDLPGESFDENTFSVYDVDGDGEDELIFNYITGSMAQQFEAVYHYNTFTNTLETKLTTFPATEFYTDGFVKCNASHNHSLCMDFWPYDLMHFSPNAGEYVNVASISAWDKNYKEEDASGVKFPEEYDKDGDGVIYYIQERGMEDTDVVPVDIEELDSWIKETMGEASVITLPQNKLTTENIDAYQG